jgi:hypothetical protein
MGMTIASAAILLLQSKNGNIFSYRGNGNKTYTVLFVSPAIPSNRNSTVK